MKIITFFYITFFISSFFIYQIPSYSQSEQFELCIDGTQNSCKCNTSLVLCSINDLDGFEFKMDTFLHFEDGPHGNGFMCPGQGNTVSDNPTWFTFPAWCTDLTIEVCYDSCVTGSRCPFCCTLGIQAAVYSECFGCPDCYGPSWHANSFNPPPYTFAVSCAVAGVCGPAADCIVLEMSDVIIGKLYYFLIDGCCGSACDVTINILTECEEPETYFPPLSGIEGPEEVNVCEEVTYSHPVPESASLLHWFIDGEEVQVENSNSENLFQIVWEEPGTYELCFSVSHICSSFSEDVSATCITVNVHSLEIETNVFLEGMLMDPSNSGEYLQEMRTNLNSSRVLPGQTYFSFLFGSNYTPPGQPYSVNPWNYFGSEGEAFDSEGNMANSDADYPSTVVDWVLVTLRPGSSPVSPAVWRTAALLHKDGSIELLKSLPCCSVDESLSYYLMIQHRNHMPVMSHQAVQFVNGVLAYDFRSQDSYIFDIFGFGAVGQKEVESGVYAMFAGNGDQTIANQSEIEINFNDKQRFDEDLGIQQQYSIGDYNLDGNVQFNDKLALIENLGSQSSVSPVSSVATSEVEIDCESAELNGSLSEGEAAEEVWIEINYSSGCGEYAGQEIPSTGVEGLTATLEAGVFEEDGGVLVLSISGTPNSGGTALFLLNIAGETCSLEVAVESSGPSYPTGTVHCDPDNPTEIVEVLNPATGRIWMDRNLGASRVAQSRTDSQAYGDLYQWGRGADGHQCRNSPTTTTLSSNDQPGHGDFITVNVSPLDWRSPQNESLWQGINGINNPCPEGFRVPTEAELNAERLSWSIRSEVGAFASPLKFSVAGNRIQGDGSLHNVGGAGNYWTATVIGVDSRYLAFGYGSSQISKRNRARGLSLRCIKD